ncbi:hypothetical protein I4F81_004213 [Pyropia yezoensis]|uniref:Uncharacterized protein n=1 Tax=Pyropia yezoensis TaxID=2788 RepID=A0ACC3BUB2_PYRYE|nr:hypothetical protein I4F81_004213 [Neopyropia yezoensis]
MWRSALRPAARAATRAVAGGVPPALPPPPCGAAPAAAAPTVAATASAAFPASRRGVASSPCCAAPAATATGGAGAAGGGLSNAPGAGPLWGRGLGPGGFSFPGARRLEHIVKLPLLTKLDGERVREVWGGFHADHATAIGDIFTDAQRETWRARIKRCPNFVIPVAAGRGYYVLFLQAQDEHLLATPLDAYKANPATATPSVVFTAYEELRAKTGLTLLRGEVFTETCPKVEAERFWETVKRFYLSDQRNFDVVVSFNEKPANFNWKDVLRVAGVSA